MARDENAGNHSDDEERGVQAFRAEVCAQGRRFNGIERSLREMQQTLAGLKFDEKRLHYSNRNCVDEMAHGRLVVGRVATPQAVTSIVKNELRLAHKFMPSQSSSSCPVTTTSATIIAY
jgi:hypothetical protein